MNPIIEEYFAAIEVKLLQSPIIVTYQIVRRDIAPADGKLRVKAVLGDGGIAELFEYVSESDGEIQLLKYSFHWQDGQGNLRKRWDNAPHYPHLPHAPHHMHQEDGTVQEVSEVPSIVSIIQAIEDAV
jgi:hypothetical protein